MSIYEFVKVGGQTGKGISYGECWGGTISTLLGMYSKELKSEPVEDE